MDASILCVRMAKTRWIMSIRYDGYRSDSLLCVDGAWFESYTDFKRQPAKFD
jgi:hypothetical protein